MSRNLRNWEFGIREALLLKINRLDHLVLTVKDLDQTCDFYTDVLGMEMKIFSGNRRALAFGIQKINLHQYGNELEPRALKPTPGAADLCFITDVSIDDVVNHLKARSVQIIEGPVEKAGAQGSILSVYFRDPDGNLIEVSNTL